MIEQFTPEQIEQIKTELGFYDSINKYAKRNLSAEKKRLNNLFSNDFYPAGSGNGEYIGENAGKPQGVYGRTIRDDIWKLLLCCADHITENYVLHALHVSNPTNSHFHRRQYVRNGKEINHDVFRRYVRIINDFLDLIEREVKEQ